MYVIFTSLYHGVHICTCLVIRYGVLINEPLTRYAIETVCEAMDGKGRSDVLLVSCWGDEILQTDQLLKKEANKILKLGRILINGARSDKVKHR